MIDPPEDQHDEARGNDPGAESPGTESVIELDPAEAEAFLERVGTMATDEEPDHDSEIDEIDDDTLPNITGYEVLGVVGRGATGIVYRARQEAVDRPVALKVLHRELITNRRAVRRLQREARLAAKLAHPSIISAIDMGEIDGLWWYAMELVVGVPLSRRIAERGSLTEREVLRLFSPLCDALQHAHEVGVVHRDIKPANILIDGRGRARLVDLGLAMGLNDPSITRTGSTLGTPHYVSPEQARDPSQADIRSDIWSVGATMYHAVCGRPPFHAEAEEDGGVAEILSRVLYEPVVDPREFSPGLSKDFSLLLRKCLTRDPSQRYQEPWELVADIELLRERRRLDLRGSQLDPYASRRPAWVGRAAAAAALVLAIGGTWAITARPWEDRPGPVFVDRDVELGDWPELHAIDQGFEARTLSHAEALADLESPALLSLPENAQFLMSDLLVRVKDDLDSTVRSCLSAAESEVDRGLEAHAFDRADMAIAASLDDRLRARTGFSLVDELPEGSIQRRAEVWRRDQFDRVREAHDAAVRAAANALQIGYARTVRDRVDVLLAERRWLDAWSVLSPASPLDWLELDGIDLDLRGLDADDRREVVDVIQSSVRSKRSDVQYRVTQAIDDASDFIDAERLSLMDEINDGRVRGDTTAAERLTTALEAKHKSLGLSLDQLTPGLGDDYRAKIETVTQELEELESRLRGQLALSGVRELERTARPLLASRRYGAVRDLYAAARNERWRASTFDVIDARLREIDLLEDVLARAVRGVTNANREDVELTFDGIRVRGRLEASGAATARLGFALRPTASRSNPLRVVLRHEQLEGGAREHVLEADDVLRFAGLSDEIDLSPGDQLAAAAFLAAEDRPTDARKRIRLQDYEPTDVLPADLENRVRRRADATRAAVDDESERAVRRPSPVTPAQPRTFIEAFGVPNQTDVGRRVRLVWDFVEDGSQKATDLPRALPGGEARGGAWRARGWSLESTGYALTSDLKERADLLAGDVGPTLALVEPLRVDEPIEVRIEFVPGDHRPEGHVVALSVRGYHLLLVGKRFDPRIWFGTGDFKTLVAQALDGAEGRPELFYDTSFPGLRDDEPVTIELAIRAGRLEALTVDGKRISDIRTMYGEPRLPDPYVRFRSTKPLTLRAAEIRGARVPLNR